MQHRRARINSYIIDTVSVGEVLTTSHRASNAVERQRILARGGNVPECSKGECARVNGLIEVTRSLGDRWLKPVLDCTPEVVARDLTADDAFLVIGSDGLFDCVDDATVVCILCSIICETCSSMCSPALANGGICAGQFRDQGSSQGRVPV